METEIIKTIAKIDDKIMNLRSPQFSKMSLMQMFHLVNPRHATPKAGYGYGPSRRAQAGPVFAKRRLSKYQLMNLDTLEAKRHSLIKKNLDARGAVWPAGAMDKYPASYKVVSQTHLNWKNLQKQEKLEN